MVFSESKSLRYEIELDENNYIVKCFQEIKEIIRKDKEIIHTNIVKKYLLPEEVRNCLIGLKYPSPPIEVKEPEFKQI